MMPKQQAAVSLIIALIVALAAVTILRPHPQIVVVDAPTPPTTEPVITQPPATVATEAIPSTTVSVDDLFGVPWAETFVAVSAQYGISPYYLAALASCETDFVPRQSSAGADGLMQVMPGTAAELNEWYGKDLDPDVPEQAIELAAIYTIRSIEVLQVHDPVVLARAYNAGNGAVERDLPIAAETRRHMDCVRERFETIANQTGVVQP